MNKLYENIKTYRKANGWSQDELAKRMGYTDRSTIAKIESGLVDLAESKIMAFAKVLGVKPSVLMGWSEDDPDSNRVTKALEFYDQYEHLSPKDQIAFQTLLKSLQSGK